MRTIILILFILSLNSCNDILCGKLDPALQEMIDDANNMYKNSLVVEEIPCEFYYIDVFLKTEEVDTNKIRSIHKILYNEENNQG